MMLGKPALFVYGSLLTGTGNPSLDRAFARCTHSRTDAWVNATLYDLGDYPGAVAAERTSDRVHGALFALAQPERCLALIDRYEGYWPDRPEVSEFVRTTIMSHRPGGHASEAWIYLYNGPVRYRPRIPQGSWVRRRQTLRTGD